MAAAPNRTSTIATHTSVPLKADQRNILACMGDRLLVRRSVGLAGPLAPSASGGGAWSGGRIPPPRALPPGRKGPPGSPPAFPPHAPQTGPPGAGPAAREGGRR